MIKIFMAAFLGIMILASSVVVAEEGEWNYAVVCVDVRTEKILFVEKSRRRPEYYTGVFKLRDLKTNKIIIFFEFGGDVCRIMHRITYEHRYPFLKNK